ncbi:hypothetical protein, partial [Neisseria meningitidis]|uniref:hypothetical protein n=1 Tax=Neisseria meningitidis TaxID=487 RepID=UPI00197BC829
MTVERFQLLPINAAISNPVIPSKTEKQNQKPKIPSFPQLFVIPACTGMTAERFQLFLNKFLQRWIF